MHLSSVVLPAPFGPTIDRYSPRETAKETPRRISFFPRRKEKSRTASTMSGVRVAGMVPGFPTQVMLQHNIFRPDKHGASQRRGDREAYDRIC